MELERFIVAMRWTQIKALAESKSFWSLNILLIVVPFFARVRWLNVSQEMLLLYIASILVTISTLLYFIFSPEIITFRGSNEFKELGKTPKQLAEEYEKCGFNLNDIEDEEIKIILENESSSDEIENKSFWYVHNRANTSRIYQRGVITFLYLIAFVILIGVNGYRFILVMRNVA